MKKFATFAGAVAAVYAGAMGVAFAVPVPAAVPEPGSLALVGVAIAGLVAVGRKRK